MPETMLTRTTAAAEDTERTRSVALEWFSHLTAGRIGEALELCDENIEFINYRPVEGYNTAMSWIGTHIGRDAVLASFQGFVSVAEVMREDVTDLVVEGDIAVAFVHEESRVRTTGKTFTIDFVQRLTVRNGSIVRWQSFTDPSEILRALV